MKKCYKCQRVLGLDCFAPNKSRKDGLQAQCRDCQKEYRRQHYLKNRQKYIDKAAVWKRGFAQRFEEYKSGFKCSVCGEGHPACLDFHHEGDKENAVSYWAGRGNMDMVEEEASKCVPLCSNCHRKLHYDMRH